jgi:hypothetical protein
MMMAVAYVHGSDNWEVGNDMILCDDQRNATRSSLIVMILFVVALEIEAVGARTSNQDP